MISASFFSLGTAHTEEEVVKVRTLTLLYGQETRTRTSPFLVQSSLLLMVSKRVREECSSSPPQGQFMSVRYQSLSVRTSVSISVHASASISVRASVSIYVCIPVPVCVLLSFTMFRTLPLPYDTETESLFLIFVVRTRCRSPFTRTLPSNRIRSTYATFLLKKQ